MSYLEYLGHYLPRSIPEIVLWSAGVGIGIILVCRHADKASKLLLSGSICLLVAVLSDPFLRSLVFYRYGPDTESSTLTFATMISFISGLPVGLLSFAGFVFLAIAFWSRFRKKRVEATY